MSRSAFEFPVSTEDCELLVSLEQARGLTELAELCGRNVSVLSRQLSALSRQLPAVEKQAGRWRLTPLGRELAQWARSAQAAQQRLLEKKSRLRIGATREFASRVLIPGLADLLGDKAESCEIEVRSDDTGVEGLLLGGLVDLGFDCGRPENPTVRFRRVKAEPLSLVAAPAFIRAHRIRTPDDLLEAPNLHHERLPLTRILQLQEALPNIFGRFSDLASTRAACVAGFGWAVLPTYTVRAELLAGKLKPLPWRTSLEPDHFSVFWLSGSGLGESWSEPALTWLKKQNLE